MDVAALERLIGEVGAEHVPLVHDDGHQQRLRRPAGQPGEPARRPRSLQPARLAAVSRCLPVCRERLVHQDARAGPQDRPVAEIVQEMFDLADGATISAKKDGLVNIGGVLLVRDRKPGSSGPSNLLILTEGYVTYGGLAGRDLEAMAQGFHEVLDEDYLHYRIRSRRICGRRAAGGGHADRRAAGRARHLHRCFGVLPAHSAGRSFPARRWCARCIVQAGMRAVEIGSVMFGRRRARPSPGHGAGAAGLSAPRVHAEPHGLRDRSVGEIHAQREQAARPADRLGSQRAAAFYGQVRGESDSGHLRSAGEYDEI